MKNPLRLLRDPEQVSPCPPRSLSATKCSAATGPRSLRALGLPSFGASIKMVKVGAGEIKDSSSSGSGSSGICGGGSGGSERNKRHERNEQN